MARNGKKELEQAKAEAESSTQIVMTITYDTAARGIRVEGPISDKGVCYMMLELAKDAVRSNVDRQLGDSRIVQPFRQSRSM